MATQTLEKLVSKQGLSPWTLEQLRRDTIPDSAQITTGRRNNEVSKRNKYWVAQSALYIVENGEAIVCLTTGENNLIFDRIEQIPFVEEDIEAIIRAESTLRVKLSNLNLIKRWKSAYSSYFEINTHNYNAPVEKGGLNSYQRTFAERVFRQGNDFKLNTNMFRQNRISGIRVILLSETYVKNNIEQEDYAIMRACMLYGFGINSDFNATIGKFGKYGGVLLGKPYLNMFWRH